METDQGDGGMPPTVDPDGIETQQEFGLALSQVREAADLTVRQLADRAVVPRGTVQGYLKGDHLPPAGFPDPLLRILRACGERAPARLDAWIAAAARARRAPGRRRSDSPSPFPGLASYGSQDTEWFHGRDDLTAAVVTRLERKLTTGGGPLVVVGPSGAGKTSLLTAGVVPTLRARGHDASLLPHGAPDPRDRTGWRGVVVADQFEEVFARDVDSGDRVAQIGALCRQLPGTAVVLGVRADFYPHLLRHPALAAAAQADQVVVGPMTRAELRAAITVPLRRARVDPEEALVDLVLRDLEPKSAGPDGGAHDPGALPLLSHALRAAWSRHEGSRLTVADYMAGGGVARSVAQSADEVLDGLTSGQQEEARRLFRRLVRADEDTADTRRRVPLAELLDARAEPGTVSATETVLERFTTARLLTVDEHSVEITHEALLTAWPRLRAWLDADREWLLLHRRTGTAAEQWRAADRDPDLLYRAGALASLREWTDQRGRRGDLNALELEFLGAGEAHRQAADSRARRRVRQRYQMIALVTVLLVVVASVADVAAQQRRAGARERTQALSRQVAGEADHLRGNNVALSLQLALASYRIAATPEARSALIDSTATTPDTQTAPPAGAAVSLATNGALVVGGVGGRGVQLWSAGPDGRLSPRGAPLTGPRGTMLPVALSRDGTRLAATDLSGTIRLWNTSRPSAPVALGALHGPPGRIVTLALSSDGTRLAAGSADGTVRVWHLGADLAHAPSTVLAGTGTAQVESVVFTPDGSTLAAGDDSSAIRLWRTGTPGRPSQVTTPGGRVFSLAVSPDGRTLGAGTSTGHDVTLWRIADPAHPAAAGSLTGPSTWVNTIAFSPDGRTVAAGSSDGVLWLFDARSHHVLRQLPHPRPVISVGFLRSGTPLTLTQDGLLHTWHLPGPILIGARDSVFAVSFDADGHRLGVAPGANDDTVTVWDPTDVHHPVRLGPPLRGEPGARGFSGSGALSPDGRTFAVGNVDGTVTFWDVTDPAHPVQAGAPVRAASALIESVSYDRRGNLLATAADDNTVRLFSVRATARPAPLARIVLPGGGEVLQTAYSPDATLLAAVSSGGHAYLYDIARPGRPRLLASLDGFSDAVYCAAFSPDGQILAVGAADGTVRLWDVSRPARPVRIPGELSGPVGYIYAVAFSPAGRTLVVSSNEDADLWLWDLDDPRRPRHLATLTGPDGGVFTAAFAPRGGVLAAGGVQHAVQLWDTDPDRAAAWICSIVGRPITRSQWEQYLPSRRYHPPCSAGRGT